MLARAAWHTKMYRGRAHLCQAGALSLSPLLKPGTAEFAPVIVGVLIFRVPTMRVVFAIHSHAPRMLLRASAAVWRHSIGSEAPRALVFAVLAGIVPCAHGMRSGHVYALPPARLLHQGPLSIGEWYYHSQQLPAFGNGLLHISDKHHYHMMKMLQCGK